MSDDYPVDDSGNPYSDDGGMQGQQYQGQVEPHRGTLLIVFAILGWFVCAIFGIVAWVMARGDLAKMRAGQMDRSGEGLTQAAKVVAMVNVILIGLVLVGYCLLMVVIFGFAGVAGVQEMDNQGLGIEMPVPAEEFEMEDLEETDDVKEMLPPPAGRTTPPVQDPGNAAPGVDPGAGTSPRPGADPKAKTATVPGASIEEQYRRVFSLANQNNLDGALQLAETTLADGNVKKLSEKQQRNLLLVTTRLNQSVGIRKSRAGDSEAGHALFLKGAAHFRSLKNQFKPLTPSERGVGGNVFYNEACALSLAGEKQAALASLKESFEHGWNNFDHISKDPDLENLRQLPEFTRFLAAQKVVVAERTKKALVGELARSKPFPFAFSLPDLDGKPLSLESQKGKVVIVDIWGTWCPPCRAEIPHFVKLQERYGKDGLQIIGINYERGQNPVPGIKAFAKEFGINYPCVIGDPATRDQVPAFRGYPTTLFIDRSGAVRMKVVGLTPYERLEAIVTTLLAEPAPGTGKKAATKARPAAKKPAAKKKPARKKPAVKTSAVRQPAWHQAAV